MILLHVCLQIPGFRPVDVVLASNDHTTYSLTSLATLGAMASSSRFWGDKDKEKPKLPTKVGIVVDIDRRSKSKTPQVCVRSSMKVCLNFLDYKGQPHYTEVSLTL